MPEASPITWCYFTWHCRTTLDLQIHNLLSVGDGCNVQIFTVEVLGTGDSLAKNHFPQDTEKTKYVAKVYDPLYLNDDDGYLNPFLCVDQYYTHEANAYELLTEFQGNSVPRFFESYYLNLPVGKWSPGIYRTVRLI